MSPQMHKYLNIFLALAVVVLLYLYVTKAATIRMLDNDQPQAAGEFSAGGASHQVTIELYFGGANGAELAKEERLIATQGNKAAIAKEVIVELIAGPKDEMMIPVIPAQTKLLSVYTDQDEICYLDFSQDFREGVKRGSSSELLAINSIIKTLAANVESLKQVQFLFDGEVAETLGGHIDIRTPLSLH